MNQLNQFENRPFDSIKDNLTRLIERMTNLVKKIKDIIAKVQRLVITLGKEMVAYINISHRNINDDVDEIIFFGRW